MKTKNNLIRISLISLVLLAIMGIINTSYGSIGSEIKEHGLTIGVEALSGVLLLGIQQLALVIFAGLHAITAAITGASGDAAVSIGSIVFNKCGLTSANFFPEVWVGPKLNSGLSSDIMGNIQKYYMIIRNLSIALLLGILIYIGIRMAISTVASQKAKYKEMFGNWLISLLLVFVLHYIMIITFFINNSLVYVLSTLDTASPMDYAGMMISAAVPGYGIADLVVYGALVTGTLAFTLMYLQRTIVLGFLIVIAPLITVTYSIDKIGDGKSQALNAWLKEFIFTVIIQPFHCVIYLVFYNSVMSSLSGAGQELSLGNCIFAIASILFMLKAEDIVKKIFGIQPGNIGNVIGTGAMAIGMATNLFKGGNSKKINESKGKMPKMENNISSTQTKGNGQSASQSSSGGNATSTSTPQTTASTPTSSGEGSGEATSSSSNSSSQSSSSAGNTSLQQSSTATSSSSEENAIKEALSKVGSGVKNGAGKVIKGLKRYDTYRGGWKGAVTGAATLAGFIAGASVGDFKSAASVGTAAGGIAKSKYEKAQYRSAEKQLAENQQVFAGTYNDYANAYRAMHADADEQEIRAAAKRVYDSGGQGLVDEWDKDLYTQMEKLSDSAEIMGYSDGFDYVNETMRLTDEGAVKFSEKYVPKFYTTKKKK